jgi:trimethylamine--corrinoid protein Co-methyltransferase
MISGIEVNDDTVALDLIDRVGPIPGEFLSSSHTRAFWRQSLLLPQLADRLGYSEWIQRGKPTLLDYAKERYREILSADQTTPLTEAQSHEVETILHRLGTERAGGD